ncbi:MAG: S41 family peptidase [Polyangia bacterium]
MRLPPRLGLAFAVLPVAACAGTGRSALPQAAQTRIPQQDSTRPTEPPPFTPLAGQSAEAPAAMGPGRAQLQLREEIFAAAWTAVRDKDFDKTLVGQDWEAARTRYHAIALAGPDEATFYRTINEMLGTLGQSHLEVHGPGEIPDDAPSPPPMGGTRPATEVIEVGTGVGDPGLLVRSIEGRPTVSQVRPGSSAARSGLRTGYLITRIAGRDIAALPASPRALRPVEERFRLRRQAARLLSGPVGSKVSVQFLDGEDQAHEALLTRDPPPRPAVQALLMPPIVPEVRTARHGEVGVIAFNFFLLEPILSEVQSAIDGFRRSGAKALIIDLRGNPGGFGGMAIPVAARLVNHTMSLGTIQFRDFANTLTVEPPLGSKPFTGKVILLTDEGSASTSEILASGLQEAKRATVVGEGTVGAALGSTIESLPGGAVIQIPVAGFKTPRGVAIEGRGVRPDCQVTETRAALLAGRDPVLEAALELAHRAD